MVYFEHIQVLFPLPPLSEKNGLMPAIFSHKFFFPEMN